MSKVLEPFSAPVRSWFHSSFGEATPPQVQGWPVIQGGDHTLILAPTGSGKTLAAFLWGIDELYRDLVGREAEDVPRSGDRDSQGVRILYVSPLKALNNDIHRNLRVPLRGIRKAAQEQDLDFPTIELAVRSGDTPQRERQAMVKKPPHILITTPESLYLMLTSPRARGMFATVRTVIVDEIHMLAGSKRGVHLSLSLERLEELAEQSIQRIGLSATIRPLEEVAHFLGGNHWVPSTEGEGEKSLEPRPVTVVDAGYQKRLDLRVVSVVDDFRNLPGDSIWPAIIPPVLSLIRQHQTTLIFANNRRLAERAADWLNEQLAAEAAGQETGLVQDGVPKGLGILAAGTGLHAGPVRVHHGSMAKEVRLHLEQKLKEGHLKALVGTSSLELGIDIGSIDLVLQLQSPKAVSQGLQRVGRSGHLVGQTSRGYIFPTFREDLVEAAAIAGGMLRGQVEPTHTPRNPLDVLAQQIVAMVAVDSWDADDLYDLVRRASAYETLSTRLYRSTLDMLTGRYEEHSQVVRQLRARIVWDRVNNRLAELPGSRVLALTNGGTISDRGAFGTYLADGKTKLGELDEEFVYETRVGDSFIFGSQVWRVIDITDDKVMVVEAPGAAPRMPFWHGDFPWRPYSLGQSVGRFRRVLAERLQDLQDCLGVDSLLEIKERRDHDQVQSLIGWLEQDYALDKNSAWLVLEYVASQIDKAGTISSDRTVVVEVFDDQLGDPRLVVHSPFGGRVNGPWGLALAGALRERMGVGVELQTNDDGILLRFPEGDAEFPVDIVADMGPAEARERILQELPDSAVFGAHFRQNANRALLLPGLRGGKRTPFWLQRLRAKDLLQVVRRLKDFPIVAETYRDCLQDVMDLPHLEEVLGEIQGGQIEMVLIESTTPSPVAQSLLWDFTSIYMYEWDTPKAEQQLQTLAASRDLLQDLLEGVKLDDLLRSDAIQEIRDRLQQTAPTSRARTAEELALLLQQLGDLSSLEIAQRSAQDPADWIARLAGQDRIVPLSIPTAQGQEERWVLAEYAAEYKAAFQMPEVEVQDQDISEARSRILERFLYHSGPVTVVDVRARYAFPGDWLQAQLNQLVKDRQLAQGRFTPGFDQEAAAGEDEFVDRSTLGRIHRRTLTILRNEVKPVPFTVYADFLARWQHLHPGKQLGGKGALRQILQQLRAVPVIGQVWERDVLNLRLTAYDRRETESLCQEGDLIWVGSGGVDPRHGRVRFLFRGEGNLYLESEPENLSSLSQEATAVHGFLQSEGAVFFANICDALDMGPLDAEAALVELVMAGLVTNDSLDAMRQIVQRGSATPTGQEQTQLPFGRLEEQLAERLGPRPLRPRSSRRPSRASYKAASRQARRNLEQRASPGWVGRWSLVHRFGVMGKPVDPEEQAAHRARQLLQRHGVVTYQALRSEENAWTWAAIYHQLQRMEMRGEIRRGYFVGGLPGVQFALPEVVEDLREIRDETGIAEGGRQPVVVLNACDPANLYGSSFENGPVAADGQPLRFSRISSTWSVQQRGLPLLVAESGAARLTSTQGANPDSLRVALKALADHLAGFEDRVQVESWNGEPIQGSQGQALLESIGFYRDSRGMSRDRPSRVG